MANGRSRENSVSCSRFSELMIFHNLDNLELTLEPNLIKYNI